MGICAASVLAVRRCARALALVGLAAFSLACASREGPTVAIDLPMPVLIGPVLYVGGTVPEEVALAAALPPVSHLRAHAKERATGTGGTSQGLGPVTVSVGGSRDVQVESSFEMEPMPIPHTSAVAIITTIRTHCWFTFFGLGISECQVSVEGDVYPKEAFDPGHAKP